ncbi:hypothetical protein ACWC24_27620 [Streptomyces sp. NPDC001443]
MRPSTRSTARYDRNWPWYDVASLSRPEFGGPTTTAVEPRRARARASSAPTPWTVPDARGTAPTGRPTTRR